MTTPAGIMIAPNGARLTTSDHPAIPVTEKDTVATVVACVEAGACAVHLHVRDADQIHVLDVDQYRSATTSLQASLGHDFPVQITSEAVGVYSQPEQIQMVQDLKPAFASVALAEIIRDEEMLKSAETFYHWADQEKVGLQHILYSAEDLSRFLHMKSRGVIPADQWSILFVLGRYTKDQQSDPEDIASFLSILDENNVRDKALWMICAFGQHETACLCSAVGAGGHARVGFENNRHHADGSIAGDNVERVDALITALMQHNQTPCDRATMRKLLGER